VLQRKEARILSRQLPGAEERQPDDKHPENVRKMSQETRRCWYQIQRNKDEKLYIVDDGYSTSDSGSALGEKWPGRSRYCDRHDPVDIVLSDMSDGLY
jgi:hypothetical protein